MCGAAPSTKRPMSLKLVLGIGSLLVVACGASGASSGDDSGAPVDSGGAVPDGGAPPGNDDAGPKDASAIDATADGGSDAGTSWRCGHGTFTQTDAATACAVPNMYLDNGPGAAVRYCDGANLTGGTWEVWCSGGPLLVKLHIDGLTGTDTHSGCMGFTGRKVLYAWSQLNGSGSGMLPKSGAPVAFDIAKSITVDLATLGNTHSDQSGSGHLYLLGEFPGPCGNIGPRAVMSGVAVSWNATTGN